MKILNTCNRDLSTRRRALVSLVVSSVVIPVVYSVLINHYLILGFILAILYILVFFAPIYGLCAFFAITIILGTGFETGIFFLGGEVPSSYLLIMILIVPAILKRAIAINSPPLNLKPVLISIGLIAIFTTIGFLNGNDLGTVRKEISIVLPIPIVYLWTGLVLTSKKNEEAIIKLLCLATAVATLKALFLLFSGKIINTPDLWQAYSTMNPQFGVPRIILIGADTYFTVVPPLLVALFFLNKQRTLIGILMILCFSGLLLSFTRSNWIATIFGIILTIYYLKDAIATNKSRLLPFIGIGGLLCLFVFDMTVGGNTDYTLGEAIGRRLSFDPQMGSGTFEFRIRESWELINEVGLNFLTGKGLGGEFYNSYLGLNTYWAHSGLSTVYLKTGIIGLFLLICSLFSIFKKMRDIVVPNKENTKGKFIIIGATGSMIALLIMSITNNRLFSMEGTAFIGFYLGLMQYYSSQINSAPKE